MSTKSSLHQDPSSFPQMVHSRCTCFPQAQLTCLSRLERSSHVGVAGSSPAFAHLTGPHYCKPVTSRMEKLPRDADRCLPVAVVGGDGATTKCLTSPRCEFCGVHRSRQRLVVAGQILLFTLCVVQIIMLYRSYVFGAAACAAVGVVDAAAVRRQQGGSSSQVEQPFQTTPELFPGVFETNAHSVSS